MRVIALLTLLLPAVFYCSVEEAEMLQGICCALASSMTVLMMYPLSYEDIRISVAVSVPSAILLMAVPPLSLYISHACELTVLASLCLLMVYDYIRARFKLVSVKMLFRLDSVWCNLEDYARRIFESLLLALCAIMLAMGRLGAGMGHSALLCMAMFALFVLMYKRAWTGRTMLLSEKRENRVQEIVRGNLRSFPAGESEDEYMSSLYARVLDYMETCKPYLDPTYSLDDMARDLFSNKVYLSRAVNFYSGRNFKQFVNYYRVKHSIELMRSGNPDKIIQIAMKSGFHSVVTFSMAFKLNTRKTPGEYLRDIDPLLGKQA